MPLGLESRVEAWLLRVLRVLRLSPPLSPPRSRLWRLSGLLPWPSPRPRPRFSGRSGSAESRPDTSCLSSIPNRLARSVSFCVASSTSMPKRFARSARFFASSSAAVDERPSANDGAGSVAFSSSAGSAPTSSLACAAGFSASSVAAGAASSTAGSSVAGFSSVLDAAAASSSL